MADPTLDQLQVFLAVAEAGGFSAAARRLNRAQSVISYTVANLEAQLDIRLFERTGTRQPRLTEAGRALLADARRIQADLRQLQARARGLGQGLEAQLSVVVDALLPMPVLTGTMTAFRAEFRTVGVRLHTAVLGAITELLLRGEADLGVAGGGTALSDALVGEKLAAHTIVPVAAPSHPLAQAEPPVPDAILREHDQIVITDTTARTAGQDFHVHAFNTWRVTDVHTKRALMLAGFGWGGLPLWLIADDLAAGRLVELDLQTYPRTDYPLYALRGASRPLGPAATWLVERFRVDLAAFS